MQTQSVLSWGETEVGVWLEENGFADQVKPFVKNGINGEALASITEAELVAMKVDKLGVRKAILKAVAQLTQGVKSGGNDNNKEDISSSSSKSSKSQVQCKVVAAGQTPWTLNLNLDSEVSFQKLSRKLEHKLLFQASRDMFFFSGSVVLKCMCFFLQPVIHAALSGKGTCSIAPLSRFFF